jgi:hypothetical protein
MVDLNDVSVDYVCMYTMDKLYHTDGFAMHFLSTQTTTMYVEQTGALQYRVARWYIFIPKIPIWVTFGVP